MESVKTLIKLWKAEKHIPQGKSLNSLVQVSSLHQLTNKPGFLSSVKVALKALSDAWRALENGVSSDTHDGLNLTTEELLLIAKIVPLFIPAGMGKDLRTANPSLKRKHENSADVNSTTEEAGLTEGDTLNLIDDEDRGIIASSSKPSSIHLRKRARRSPTNYDMTSGEEDPFADTQEEDDHKGKKEKSERHVEASPSSDSDDDVIIDEERTANAAAKGPSAGIRRQVLKPTSRQIGQQRSQSFFDEPVLVKKEKED